MSKQGEKKSFLDGTDVTCETLRSYIFFSAHNRVLFLVPKPKTGLPAMTKLDDKYNDTHDDATSKGCNGDGDGGGGGGGGGPVFLATGTRHCS